MSHHREVVTAIGAPAAVGPYSHAVKSRGLLFCSGQLPLDPESGELVGDSPGTQLTDAVRLTIYTTVLDQFAEINEAYGEHFAGDPPARVAIGAAALPKGAMVEIDAIVALTD